MTTPSAGAPDWQSLTSLHGAPILDNAFNIPANTLQTLFEGDSSSWPAVHIGVTGAANGGTLTIRSTETASNLVDTIAGQWVIRPDTRLSVTVPLPRTKVGIDAQSEVANPWTFTLRAAPTSVGADKHHYYGAATTLSVNNRNINAGVTDRWFPTSLLPGPAHIWFFNNAPPNQLEISVRSRDADGTATARIAQWISNVVNFNDNFILPHRLWEIDITNLAGVPNNYWFTVASTGMQT